LVEEITHDGGPAEAPPLVKAAVGFVIGNPFAGRPESDLAALIEPSARWGHLGAGADVTVDNRRFGKLTSARTGQAQARGAAMPAGIGRMAASWR
jgi:Amino acid synthesis